jgi:hypothetical protein
MAKSRKKQDDVLKDEERGGLGNTGQFSRAAYNRGGLGAGMDPAAEADFLKQNLSGEDQSSEERPSVSDAAWSRRAYGPRGYAGGFVGHEYDWKTRGEKREESGDVEDLEDDVNGR